MQRLVPPTRVCESQDETAPSRNDIRTEVDYLDALESPMPLEGTRPSFHH